MHYTKKNTATYFDGIYYINLAHRTDRKKEFLRNARHLHHPNIIRFEAVYGKDIYEESWPGKPGAVGVRQSHINVLKDARLRKYNRFMVFEDDVIIDKKFNPQLLDLLNEAGDDWDMLYFYVENHHLEPVPISKSMVQLQNTLGLVGVAYQARNLDLIIGKLESDYRWVDSCMADLHQVLKVYAPPRSIVSHAVGYSDNEGLVVSYKTSLGEKLKAAIKKILKR